jgi:hypothetical protein
MDTELLEARLTKAASFLDSHALGSDFGDVVKELRRCESDLVANRFVRAEAADGRTIRKKVPEVDAALIYVSRALSLVGDEAHVAEARESVENAREEVAHLSAV